MGSNWRPLDFQSNALPLSYGPLLFHHHSFLKYYFSKLYFKSIETSLFPSTKTSTLWIRLSSISPSITPPHFYREEKSNNSYLVRYTTRHHLISSHLRNLIAVSFFFSVPFHFASCETLCRAIMANWFKNFFSFTMISRKPNIHNIFVIFPKLTLLATTIMFFGKKKSCSDFLLLFKENYDFISPCLL